MSSPNLLEKLAAYVPAPVAHAIYHQPQILTEPTARRFPAVILFSDISGFTTLTELLSEAGPTGTEELTHLINQYFTEMIQIGQAHHGQIVKFSGDALTILFPADEGDMVLATRQAGECALAMQTKMSEFSTLTTSRGHASLSMKVGIGAGKILECSVGGALGRWEYMVAGVPLVQVAMAESRAEPGQIVLSPQAWQQAQGFFTILEGKNNTSFVYLDAVIDPLPQAEPFNFDWEKLSSTQRQTAEKALECYVPGAIKDRLEEQSGWLAELRRMTIVFIGIGGVNYDASDAGEQVQNFLQATQELVYRFEGSLNKVAVDDKGTVMLILFGAPPFSHEDNPTRAVAFALDLQTVAREQGLKVSIGITEGTIFAGPVGAPNRREYTVIGDEVNLAARLMQYGRAGTIIVSDRIKERAGSHFVTESLGQISLKGKTQAQVAHLVKGEQGVQEEFMMRYLVHEEPLVGRNVELEKTQNIATKVKNGSLQVVFIEGELGLGKSRLTSEMTRQWMVDGGVGYGGKCISYDRQIPYRVWREIIAAIYGLTPNLSPQRQLVRLATGIADLEDPPDQPDYWADRLPLLADVMGLEALDNDFTRTISGQLRRNNTFALIEAILRRETERRPLLILLEDIHWADELSLSLAAYLAEKMLGSPLLLVLVHRPMTKRDLGALADVKKLPHVHTVDLAPLSSAESLELVQPLFGGGQIPEAIKEILLSRGQGNPFFLQEIGNTLLNVVKAERENPMGLLGNLNLPDTLQDVVVTHIDRLAETEKLTLKVASVIGTRFQRSLLSNVHPVSHTGLALSSQLDTLENEKLIRLEVPAPKWEYNFYNVMVQEVVYEGLLLAQRRQLHGAVGHVLEKLVPDEVEQLAFHFSRSGNGQKALPYLKTAAEKAQREYANQAAIEYYSELLQYLSQPATPESTGNIISTEYWDILLRRARLYNLIGQRDREIEDLGTLGLIAEALDDHYRRALAAKQWALQYETSGDYESSLELIERSVQLAEEAGAEKLVGEGYNQWGNLLYQRREYETAYDYLQKALLIAQKHNDKGAQADCLNSLGIVAHYQSDYDVALYFFQETIDLRRAMGGQVGLGNSLTHLGQVYYDLGQYSAAQQCYNESLALHRTIGDRAGEALAQLYLGQVYRSLGDYDTAHRLLEQSVAAHQSMGDRRHEAYGFFHLGLLYARQSQYDEAVTYLDVALLILGELDDPWALGKALSYYGWILFDKGELEEAKLYFEKALKLARETQQNAARTENIAHLGRVALAQNDMSFVDAYARHIAAFLEAYGTKGIEHLALLYLSYYSILATNQDAEQAKLALAEGQQYLSERVEQIDNLGLQQSYLEGIPENRELQELVNGLKP